MKERHRGTGSLRTETQSPRETHTHRNRQINRQTGSVTGQRKEVGRDRKEIQVGKRGQLGEGGGDHRSGLGQVAGPSRGWFWGDDAPPGQVSRAPGKPQGVGREPVGSRWGGDIAEGFCCPPHPHWLSFFPIVLLLTCRGSSHLWSGCERLSVCVCMRAHACAHISSGW